MSGHVHHGVATLIIATRQADGSMVSRRWLICDHSAEYLAVQLGPPRDEVLATAEAASALNTAFTTTPGIVQHGGRP
ncbi:hypothetical protein [Streptosporangium saharense]|uniref:hypothetical protein n=1 Tax=Streptosporangium saharense TaxID=1706840 RepID=UPI00342D44F9